MKRKKKKKRHRKQVSHLFHETISPIPISPLQNEKQDSQFQHKIATTGSWSPYTKIYLILLIIIKCILTLSAKHLNGFVMIHGQLVTGL